MQPLVVDARGTVRFKQNQIIAYLLSQGEIGVTFNLNTIPFDVFSQEDVEQFYQLMGYSLCGYSDLSFISDESKDAADDLLAAAKRRGEINL